MNMKDQFVLSDQVLNIQQSDLDDYAIPNETQIQGKSDQDLARYLNGNPIIHPHWTETY